jgi:uncharacterized membrane protein YkoI
MSGEIKTAEEATEKARAFIKKYRMIARPLKAVRENGVWAVEIDVGPILVAVAQVKIDANTGDILEYNIPG